MQSQFIADDIADVTESACFLLTLFWNGILLFYCIWIYLPVVTLHYSFIYMMCGVNAPVSEILLFLGIGHYISVCR